MNAAGQYKKEPDNPFLQEDRERNSFSALPHNMKASVDGCFGEPGIKHSLRPAGPTSKNSPIIYHPRQHDAIPAHDIACRGPVQWEQVIAG
jgi:hypothetical protein